MANFNLTILMGNLVSDPELKPIGDSNVVRFRLATNRKYSTNTGEKKEDSMFIDCEMWGNRATVISEHFKKGDGIHVNGYLKQENWESKEGEKKSKLVLSIDNFEFIDGGKKSSADQSATPNKAKKPASASLQDIPF